MFGMKIKKENKMQLKNKREKSTEATKLCGEKGKETVFNFSGTRRQIKLFKKFQTWRRDSCSGRLGANRKWGTEPGAVGEDQHPAAVEEAILKLSRVARPVAEGQLTQAVAQTCGPIRRQRQTSRNHWGQRWRLQRLRDVANVGGLYSTSFFVFFYQWFDFDSSSICTRIHYNKTFMYMSILCW